MTSSSITPNRQTLNKTQAIGAMVLGKSMLELASLKKLSAQILDDKLKITVASASSIEKDFKKNKVKKIDKSNLIGETLAKRGKEKKINEVYFDRGSYKYHGRSKAFAETLRKNGLKF